MNLRTLRNLRITVSCQRRWPGDDEEEDDDGESLPVG